MTDPDLVDCIAGLIVVFRSDAVDDGGFVAHVGGDEMWARWSSRREWLLRQGMTRVTWFERVTGDVLGYRCNLFYRE